MAEQEAEISAEDRRRMQEIPTERDMPNITAMLASDLTRGYVAELPEAMLETDLPRVMGSPVTVFGSVDIPPAPFPRILHIEWGTIETREPQWTRINFLRSFSSTPAVIANAEFRGGWFESVVFGPLSVSGDEVGARLGRDMKDWMERVLPSIRIGFVTVSFKWLASPFEAIGHITGRGMGWFWNTLAPLVSRQAQDALNSAIPLLHTMSDMPQMKQTPSPTRNISTSSFEVLGLKTAKVSWIAVGP